MLSAARSRVSDYEAQPPPAVRKMMPGQSGEPTPPSTVDPITVQGVGHAVTY
jgi:hypothetical protein